MLQVSKNVTYSGESSVETEAGAHITLATMSAVISDDNLLSISKNISYSSAYTMYKNIIDEDWEEFEEEIDEIVGYAAAGDSDWEKIGVGSAPTEDIGSERDELEGEESVGNDDNMANSDSIAEDSDEE